MQENYSIGDLVDVDGEYEFFNRVRVVEFVDDVSKETGHDISEPGFVGIWEGNAEEEFVFPWSLVEPKSYEKYLFGYDPYGSQQPNEYFELL